MKTKLEQALIKGLKEAVKMPHDKKQSLESKLEEIMKLADSATPGPWNQSGECVIQVDPIDVWVIARVLKDPDNDADLICQSRTLIPALVKALQKTIGQRSQWALASLQHEDVIKRVLENQNKELLAILEGK